MLSLSICMIATMCLLGNPLKDAVIRSTSISQVALGKSPVMEPRV